MTSLTPQFAGGFERARYGKRTYPFLGRLRAEDARSGTRRHPPAVSAITNHPRQACAIGTLFYSDTGNVAVFQHKEKCGKAIPTRTAGSCGSTRLLPFVQYARIVLLKTEYLRGRC